MAAICDNGGKYYARELDQRYADLGLVLDVIGDWVPYIEPASE